METTTLPRWNARLDASRQGKIQDFSDLIPVLSNHYNLHVQAAEFLGPYNAKQRGDVKTTYFPPDRDMVKAHVKRGGVNDFTYQSFLNSIVRFCESSKGLRALPTPHPSVIHSIQLPIPAFHLEQISPSDTIIQMMGVKEPLLVKGLRQPQDIRFIIVRPRLSKLGTASSKNWEVLFFKQNFGYIPDWADTVLNPKYAGIW